MLLDKTGEMAKHRQTTSDLLLSQVSDVMKQQRRVKEAAFKKVCFCSVKIHTGFLLPVCE